MLGGLATVFVPPVTASDRYPCSPTGATRLPCLRSSLSHVEQLVERNLVEKPHAELLTDTGSMVFETHERLAPGLSKQYYL